MPDDKQTDDVEKFLADQKSFEDRKQALIDDLLRQKDTAIKEFDDKLAKLGYRANSAGRAKRSHHKSPAAAEAQTKPKAKA